MNLNVDGTVITFDLEGKGQPRVQEFVTLRKTNGYPRCSVVNVRTEVPYIHAVL